MSKEKKNIIQEACDLIANKLINCNIIAEINLQKNHNKEEDKVVNFEGKFKRNNIGNIENINFGCYPPKNPKSKKGWAELIFNEFFAEIYNKSEKDKYKLIEKIKREVGDKISAT